MMDIAARCCTEISLHITAIEPVSRVEFSDVHAAVYQISAAYVNLGMATAM